MKTHTGIVRRIAAAAATGFEYAIAQKQPRSVSAWVAHCRSAADAAAEAIRSNPPLRPTPKRPGGWTAILQEMERRENEDELRAGRPAPNPERKVIDEAEPMEGEELERIVQAASSRAFRAAMPMLVSKKAARSYIACVAVGLQTSVFTAMEARTLLYNAQLALAAHKDSEADKPKRKAITATRQKPRTLEAPREH